MFFPHVSNCLNSKVIHYAACLFDSETFLKMTTSDSVPNNADGNQIKTIGRIPLKKFALAQNCKKFSFGKI